MNKKNQINSLSEFSINESVFKLSPVFREALFLLSNDSYIAKAILDLENQDLDTDYTFIDLSDETGYVNFTSMDKAVSSLKGDFDPIEDNDDIYNFDKNTNKYGIYSGNRQSIRIGRLINKLFPGSNSLKDIEDFTNKLKSIQSREKELISIVDGVEIANWYMSDKLYTQKYGSLANSCMLNMTDYFDIYIKNKDVCKMVILTTSGKLLARALVWKLDSCNVNGVRYYMDRIYSYLDHHSTTLKDYAIKNGWAYRGASAFRDVTFKGKKYDCNGIDNEIIMSVRVDKEINYNKFPYMDTFSRYDYVTGVLYNDDKRSKKIRGWILQSTSGGHYDDYYKPNLIQRFREYTGL